MQRCYGRGNDITTFQWGHQDLCLFVSWRTQIFTVWVCHGVRAQWYLLMRRRAAGTTGHVRFAGTDGAPREVLELH